MKVQLKYLEAGRSVERKGDNICFKVNGSSQEE